MEAYYTSAQIAEAESVVKRTIERRSIRENWPFKEVAGNGGMRRFYHLEDLPKIIQTAIQYHETSQVITAERAAIELEMSNERNAKLLKKIEQDAEKANREAEQIKEDNHRQYTALKNDDPRKQRARARYWILTGAFEYQSARKTTWVKARAEYIKLLVDREIDMPEEVSEHVNLRNGRFNISVGTLQRWKDNYRDSGMWGLVAGYGFNSGSSKIENCDELKGLVVGAMCKNPHIKGIQLLQYLEADNALMAAKTSVRSLQRFMTSWKAENAQIWSMITNPDQWKNVYMAAAGSHFESITALNQLWELDSTPADWMLKDGRHSVVGCIDMFSRRCKYFVSKTSTAAAVKQVLRRSILDWGVPQAARTDNGKDYVSVEVDTLLSDLHIRHEVCMPFASEEKGTIERLNRTMSHGILELLPGFIGHNVSERKAIESRKSFASRIMTPGETVNVELTGAELQQLIDDWCEHVYAKNPHSGLKNQTPWAVANAWTQPVRRIHDEHALDGLMTPIAGVRVVGKKGIRHDRRVFIDPTGMLYMHVGRAVTLRYDEQDMGRLAAYRNGEFICWAVDPETTGISRQEAAKAIKKKQKAMVNEQVKEMKAYTKGIKENMAQVVLDHRKAESEKVQSLPKQSVPYTTAALEQAAIALEQAEAMDRPEQDIAIAARAKTKATMLTLTPRKRVEGSPKERYTEWLMLDKKIELGDALSKEKAQWHKGYQTLPEYSTQKHMAENFKEFRMG
jgi:putative transposase